MRIAETLHQASNGWVIPYYFPEYGYDERLCMMKVLRYVILRLKNYERHKNKYDLNDSGYSGKKMIGQREKMKKKKKKKNEVEKKCWLLIIEESQSLAVEGKTGHQEIYQLMGHKCDQKAKLEKFETARSEYKE